MDTSLIVPGPAPASAVWLPVRRPFTPFFILVLSALLLFWLGGSLLQWLDPVAAVADTGVLSLLLLALLCLVVFMALSLWLLGLIWPVLNDYRKYYFQKNFKTLLPWQKLSFYMASFFLLLYAFICCMLAVF